LLGEETDLSCRKRKFRERDANRERDLRREEKRFEINKKLK